MKLKWFKRRGIFFIPSSIPGWIIFAALLIYAVNRFIDIDSRSHSVSDTLMNFVFSLLILSVAYSIIGMFTSSEEKT